MRLGRVRIRRLRLCKFGVERANIVSRPLALDACRRLSEFTALLLYPVACQLAAVSNADGLQARVGCAGRDADRIGAGQLDLWDSSRRPD